MAIAFLRTIILFITLMLSMKVMGKRQLGEMELNEFVVAVLMSDLASNPMQDIGTPLVYGIVPVITLLCCEVLISGAAMKNLRFRAAVYGRPEMIIEDGKINQKTMNANRFTVDELAEELRKKGVTDIAAIKYAVLETDGTLSVMLRAADSPATPRTLALEAQDNGYPVIVINDGRLLSENLRIAGYGEEWLRKQLKARKANSPKDVSLMSVDWQGNTSYSAKERRK